MPHYWIAAIRGEGIGEWLAARAGDAAVATVLRSGRTLTPDLGGRAATAAVGDAVGAAL